LLFQEEAMEFEEQTVYEPPDADATPTPEIAQTVIVVEEPPPDSTTTSKSDGDNINDGKNIT
jgi:hypothetical protein